MMMPDFACRPQGRLREASPVVFSASEKNVRPLGVSICRSGWLCRANPLPNTPFAPERKFVLSSAASGLAPSKEEIRDSGSELLPLGASSRDFLRGSC